MNTTKTKGGVNKKVELTPRGMLHKETVYGRSQEYETSFVKVGATMTLEQIRFVANSREREALLARLCEFGGDAKKAFTGKNSLEKNPIYLNTHQTEKLADKVKCVKLTERYTIRKDITPDLKLDKVVDAGVRAILQQRLDEFRGHPAQYALNWIWERLPLKLLHHLKESGLRAYLTSAPHPRRI